MRKKLEEAKGTWKNQITLEFNGQNLIMDESQGFTLWLGTPGSGKKEPAFLVCNANFDVLKNSSLPTIFAGISCQLFTYI